MQFHLRPFCSNALLYPHASSRYDAWLGEYVGVRELNECDEAFTSTSGNTLHSVVLAGNEVLAHLGLDRNVLQFPDSIWIGFYD